MKRNGHVRGLAFAASALFMVPMLFASTASADRFTSPNYTIDASAVGTSLAGDQTSSSYRLVSSGGESVIGNASGGSYKLTQGYVAQLEQSLQLTMSTGTLSFGTQTPGVSNTVNFSSSVITDAPGYILSVNQNNDLTSGANTIPGVSGSIASPVAWSEGTTKGLGFSMVSTNATAIDGKWNAGSSFAAFPGTATSFYTRDGFSGGATDTHNLRIRLDTATNQPTGTYTNTVTWTGTMIP